MLVLLKPLLEANVLSFPRSLHVSALHGNDLNVGSAELPFHSIRRAADVARLYQNEAVNIVIGSGRYPPLHLTAEDSGRDEASRRSYIGTASSPPAPGATVSGGVVIPTHLFAANAELTKAANANQGPSPSPGWTVVIKGSMPGGDHTLHCPGTKADTFRVLSVGAGGALDPRKGLCNILEISRDAGKSWAFAPCGIANAPKGTLDCGNDKQTIVSSTWVQPPTRKLVTVYSADLSGLVDPSLLGEIIAGDCIHGCSSMPSGLSLGGEPMHRARWPNVMPLPGGVNATTNAYVNAGAGCGAGCTTFDSAKANRGGVAQLSRWGKEHDAWIHGYFEWDWADCYRKLTSVEPTKKDSSNTSLYDITLSPPSESPKANARFYILNALSELDAPGEFYIEISEGLMLHLIQPASVTGPPSAWATGPTLGTSEAVVNISNTHHITITNLTISDGRGVGVVAVNVTSVMVTHSTIERHGQQGIYLVDATDSALDNNVVSSTGCAAIRAHGGDAFTLRRGGNTVSENTVHTFALWKRTYQAGVHWSGVGNLFIKNKVSAGPHNCFLGGGNEAFTGASQSTTMAAVDNAFRENILRNCAYEAADTGAFYVCGQQGTAFVNRNNTISGGSFIDIRNTVGTGVQSASVQAIYLDDQMSGWEISNNTFTNCQVGSFIGGGRRTIVRENRYEHCDTAQHVDNRGMGWEKSATQCTSCVGPPTNCTCNPGVVEWFISDSPAAEMWETRFPYLKQIRTTKLGAPTLNIVSNNTFCKCGQFIDASASDMKSWGSVVSNNVEVKTCA